MTKLAALASTPDSVYLFSYATQKDDGRSGLRFAWSIDKAGWHDIGQGYGFVKCDYSRWGSEKKMIDPVLIKGSDGYWQSIWLLGREGEAVALASSLDLISWEPQAYFVKAEDMGQGANMRLKEAESKRVTVELEGKKQQGTINIVPWKVVDQLIKKVDQVRYREGLASETMAEDAVRFKGLEDVKVRITADLQSQKQISDMLVGAFFEDINYAADGGLYAELIQNRDFEYKLSDKEGRDSSWNSKKAWHVKGEGLSFEMDSLNPVHPNNAVYAVLRSTNKTAALMNEGFDGIVVKKGDAYDFSIFMKALSKRSLGVLVRLVDAKGRELAKTLIKGADGKWNKKTAVLTCSLDASDAHLEIVPQGAGKLAIDMVSLFPEKTFKGRKNGLRADLAEEIADMHPKFLRFPGGCVAHGDGLENIYRWKNTIGPLEARKPQRNLWGYHQSVGLGYFEYFQFCEDIGAKPVPVLAAGVPCQNSARHGHLLGGQQGGIPMEDMPAYIQEILDLIEWANGDQNTKWGKLRAAAGHPAPFNLEYIGIGNEDLISEVFTQRFTMIYNAIKQKYPHIQVIGTVGPNSEGTDYEAGWKLADALQVPLVDEHYYVPPGWMVNNQDFYDKYDRHKSMVYLGEYAAHLRGQGPNLETALSEALYMLSLERNADVVHMASYAPLLAKEKHTQWGVDLIYFNNTEIKPTVGYYVQKLFGQNSGDMYIPSQIHFSTENQNVKQRIASSIVRDRKTGDLIVKLANLLPVELAADLDLKELGFSNKTGLKTVLSGSPEDKEAQLLESEINRSELADLKLAPYSFTVIRLKAGQ